MEILEDYVKACKRFGIKAELNPTMPGFFIIDEFNLKKLDAKETLVLNYAIKLLQKRMEKEKKEHPDKAVTDYVSELLFKALV